MKDMGKILIIGAGPTGIGAAYRLKELGYENFIVLESNSNPGGLSSSFQDDNGFTWDIGGHVQFSHYSYFDKAMEIALGKDGWFEHQRESWIWMCDRMIPYPLQYNIRFLPNDLLKKAISGLLKLNRNNISIPSNFKEWIDLTLGEGLRDIFMDPYNFKVWAYHTDKLSSSWVGERVAVIDIERVIYNIIDEKNDISWGPNNIFRFPMRGGTGAIWASLANFISPKHFIYNSTITSIDSTKNLIYTKNDIYSYDHLLSTIPIDNLCNIVLPKYDDIIRYSKQLLRSKSHIVGIGLKGTIPDKLLKKCWIYFPENNCPFYRVTVFSNYSKYNVPYPDSGIFWSLMAETSESSEKPVISSEIVDATIQGFLNTGLILSKDQVVSRWYYSAQHGYPTPSVDRDYLLNRINDYLNEMNISSRGRFGSWKYEVSNQDHSFMQGVEWVNFLLFDIPELTIRFPNTANNNWGKY